MKYTISFTLNINITKSIKSIRPLLCLILISIQGKLLNNELKILSLMLSFPGMIP